MQALLARIVPLALGVAASPLPIVAVLVTLLTKRARVGGIVLASSWVLGNVTAIAIAVFFADLLYRPDWKPDLPYEGLLTALAGIALLVIAYISRRGRFLSDDPSAPPGWVTSVDRLSPVGGAVLAFSNATTSPKNLALAIAAGVAIRGAVRVPAQALSGAVVYVVVASLSLVVPVLLYLFGGERAKATLTRWKGFLTAKAAVIMEITLFVFGIALAAKGLYDFLA